MNCLPDPLGRRWFIIMAMVAALWLVTGLLFGPVVWLVGALAWSVSLGLMISLSVASRRIDRWLRGRVES